MEAKRIRLDSIEQATRAIDALGSDNSAFMATRAVHINILIKNVPGNHARNLKRVYNDIGAEAAISSAAYHEEENVITDMIVMGTVYHHREAKRILAASPDIAPLLEAIDKILQNAAEAQ